MIGTGAIIPQRLGGIAAEKDRARVTNRTSDKRVLTQFAASKPKDLITLKELAESGEIRAAIDRQYPFEQAAEAHAYVDSGRRKGTVVLTMEE